MKYRSLLFDADNTLFDFHKSYEICFQKTMNDVGEKHPVHELKETFEEVSKELWGLYEQNKIQKKMVRYERFVRLVKKHNLKWDPIEVSKIYLEHLCTNVFFIEGAVEILEKLKPQVETLGILTNGVAYVQNRRISGSPIEKLIDFMIVSEDCEAPKPHVSMFEAAHSKFPSFKKSEILMIGDSITSDIQGAVNYGIDSCWFNPSNEKIKKSLATFEIQKIEELLIKLS